jgi:regulator of protease activity HflC (stomatin/prohibitin superfamily)
MKKLIAILIAVAAALLITSSAFAWVPPGQRGYEGQPGNQGGYQQAGQQGYEGQPGNQSGK